MDYKELAKLLGVYVDTKSYSYECALRKYIDRGEGINNSNQLAHRDYIIEDIRNLRDQIGELQDQVNRIEHRSNEEK